MCFDFVHLNTFEFEAKASTWAELPSVSVRPECGGFYMSNRNIVQSFLYCLTFFQLLGAMYSSINDIIMT